MGAPGADNGDGAVVVLSLASSGALSSVAATVSLAAAPAVLAGLGLGSSGTSARLGSSLAVVRSDDVSLSDSTLVVATGAPGADEGRGVVALFALQGADMTVPRATSIGRAAAGAGTDLPTDVVSPARPGDARGASLFAVGWQSGGGGADADGDASTAELLIGATGCDDGAENGGAVFVASMTLSGVTSGTLVATVERVLELSADGGIAQVESAAAAGDGGSPGGLASGGVSHGDQIGASFADMGSTSLDGAASTREVAIGLPGSWAGGAAAVGDGLAAMPPDDSALASFVPPGQVGSVLIASLVPADASGAGHAGVPLGQNAPPRVVGVSEIGATAGGFAMAVI